MNECLEIERRLKLSPERCFALWTDPSELRYWWGPKDETGAPFRSEILHWNVDEGATWAINMFSPDGQIYPQGGEMLEVDAPHLIRFSFHWIENGVRGPRTEISVRFEPDGAGTRLLFRQSGLADADVRDGHSEGWNECLDRLMDAAQRESQSA